MTCILIIDDDLETRDQIATTLLGAYYETYTAVDGEDGVMKALQKPPDLIVCDMVMPRLNGQGVLSELRARPETAAIPFIFLTANDSRDTVRESMNLGADDYLFKPFQVNDLLNAVSARLKHKQNIVADIEQQLAVLKLRMARTITHELRTPLSMIVSTIGLLSMDGAEFSEDEMKQMVGTMTGGTNRLNHCIEQMVYATYLTTDVYSPTSVAENGLLMPLQDLIEASINMARQFTIRPAANVNIKVSAPGEQLLVQCEPGALKQAFAEIISNALTFSPPDSTVRIAIKQDGADVRVTITDSGPGIAEEKLNEAMTWFGQVDRDILEQQGMGLGLPLATQLVAIHGGNLEVRSIVDKGTRVIIILPIGS